MAGLGLGMGLRRASRHRPAGLVPAVPQPPSYVAHGTGASGQGAIAPNYPATVSAGDLALLIGTSANEAIATPSGWAAAVAQANNGGTGGTYPGAIRQAVFDRFCAGSEDGATVAMADSGFFTTGVIATFAGVDDAAPIDVSAGKAQTSAAPTFASVTTTRASTLIVFVVSASEAFTTASLVNAALRDITKVSDFGATTIWTAIADEAGAIGASALTANVSHSYILHTIALGPA